MFKNIEFHLRDNSELKDAVDASLQLLRRHKESNKQLFFADAHTIMVDALSDLTGVSTQEAILFIAYEL